MYPLYEVMFTFIAVAININTHPCCLYLPVPSLSTTITSIESSATKMAQMLLRRLAARKQQSTAAKTATAPATDKSGESLPPSEKGQKADGHNYREADGQYPSLAARLWRKPWRPGGGGENCWEEEDRQADGLVVVVWSANPACTETF